MKSIYYLLVFMLTLLSNSFEKGEWKYYRKCFISDKPVLTVADDQNMIIECYVCVLDPILNAWKSPMAATCKKKLSCKARGPVIGKRSITEAKGLYLAGAAIDVRFEFGYGISLYPFVKNIVKWGRGFWNYQYKNPEDNCNANYMIALNRDFQYYANMLNIGDYDCFQAILSTFHTNKPQGIIITRRCKDSNLCEQGCKGENDTITTEEKVLQDFYVQII